MYLSIQISVLLLAILLSILLLTTIQEYFLLLGYLPEQNLLAHFSKILAIPATDLIGIISFYDAARAAERWPGV